MLVTQRDPSTPQSAVATIAPEGRGTKYPMAAWLIVGVEFSERFSFYGMLAILALFLTGDPARGGFGWSDAKALTLLGFYSGSMYALPAFGGYLADHMLGRRRAVAIGASLMMAGQVMMASPAFIPAGLQSFHRVPIIAALHHLGTPLGYVFRPQSVAAAIAAHGAQLDATSGAHWLSQAYGAATLGFYVAIACLILGNALMKATLVVLCGDSFAEDDPRRDAMYVYYYLGISVGSLLSGLVVGTIAQVYGWYHGFAVAAIGMSVALASYLFLGRRWLPPVAPARRTTASVLKSEATDVAASKEFSREIRMRLLLLFLLAVLLCAFSTGWLQMYGSWSLFLSRYVNRSIGLLVIPVPWFSSWNALVIIVLAPFIAALWLRLAARNQMPDIVQKYAFALACAAAGHFLMYYCAGLSGGGAKAPMWIPLIATALLSVGELVAWTSTYGFVYMAAPKGYGSAAMGGWYLMTLGAGGYLSGVPGRWVSMLGYGGTFLAIGLILSAIAATALLARGALRRFAATVHVTL